MKAALFLLTFFVATLSFGKAIETSDPSYSCQVSSFKGPDSRNVLKVGEQALIYVVPANLFKAYAISSAENFYFQYLFSQNNLNEVSYENNILRVSLTSSNIRQISVDEKTGQALFIQIDAAPYILFKPAPTYKVEFKNCMRIEAALVEASTLDLRAAPKSEQAKTSVQLSLDASRE